MVAHLKGLEQLVAAVLVDRDVVGDQDPVRAFVLLHVEDLGIELGRVIDDDQHLGLRVEVGPRPVDQLVELEFARICHRAADYSDPAQPGDLPLDLGVHVKRRLSGPGATMVAGDHQVTNLLAQLGVDLGRGQPAQLRLDVDRRLTPARASSWRISVSRSSSAAAEPCLGPPPSSLSLSSLFLPYSSHVLALRSSDTKAARMPNPHTIQITVPNSGCTA